MAINEALNIIVVYGLEGCASLRGTRGKDQHRQSTALLLTHAGLLGQPYGTYRTIVSFPPQRSVGTNAATYHLIRPGGHYIRPYANGLHDRTLVRFGRWDRRKNGNNRRRIDQPTKRVVALNSLAFSSTYTLQNRFDALNWRSLSQVLLFSTAPVK